MKTFPPFQQPVKIAAAIKFGAVFGHCNGHCTIAKSGAVNFAQSILQIVNNCLDEFLKVMRSWIMRVGRRRWVQCIEAFS